MLAAAVVAPFLPRPKVEQFSLSFDWSKMPYPTVGEVIRVRLPQRYIVQAPEAYDWVTAEDMKRFTEETSATVHMR